MRIFNEAVNKYYEFLSYLINSDKSYTEEDIRSKVTDEICGEFDNIVFGNLFPKDEYNDYLFRYINNTYTKSIDRQLPIRCNIIEYQAFINVLDNDYNETFLNPETIGKIRYLNNEINKEWQLSDIEIKNRDDKISDKLSHEVRDIIRTIIEAINTNKSIKYNNIKDGDYEYIDCMAVPIKLEYSLINDMFRLWSYDITENKLFKMNIDTMSDVRLYGANKKEIIDKYNVLMKHSMRKLKLRIKAQDYIVERCFRNFSYYERVSSYNPNEDNYELEINYHLLDEAEIIRDIMSLGSSATVIEPIEIRKRIYNRIIKAKELYE